MKKLALLLLLCGTVAVKSAVAQTEHLKLSNQYPAAGEKISFTYDPIGTPLEGKHATEGMIYFFDNKDYPAADITLTPNGKLLTGSFTVPANAKFFFFKLNKDTSYDSNNGLGYTSYVYKNQSPVVGAYASKAYMLISGRGTVYAKIKSDAPVAIGLFQKEFELHPESKKDYQNYYVSLLMSSKDPATKALADGQITQMAQSGDEQSMINAANFLTRIKKTTSADSLNAVIKAKFPNGIAASNAALTAFSKEKDPVKKEALYHDFVKNFPQSNPNTQESLRVSIASAYLTDKKYADYARIALQIKNKASLASILNNAAWESAQKDENIAEDAKLSKQSLALTHQLILNPAPVAYQSPKSLLKAYKSNLNMYGDTYAYILAKQGKFAQAYIYEAPAYKEAKGMDASINENYANILNGMGKSHEAMKVIEQAIQNGKSTGPMIATLKGAYVKVKKSDKGFDAYYAPLRSFYIEKLKTELTKEMINKPAPTFALKDFDGKTVSLADLKGKVVIVDFWATWCGPCKASFPGMQLAVTKYKDDPNVKFLFIDTWETIENYQAEAKKFIADNKYTFNVLEDEKMPDGKHGKIVTDYGVDGIPTKFILDGSGNIRFKKIGWDGSTESLVDEVSIMIDITAHAASAPGGQKVSMIKTDE